MPREARLDAVIDAAARLFSANGFSATSVREVADGAHMTKAGLYYHFPDKDGLLYRICVHAISGVLEGAYAVLAAMPDPRARLSGLLRNHFDYFIGQPHFLAVLNRERKALSPGQRTRILSLEREYLDLIRGVIGAGQAAGRLRAIDPGVAAFTMLTVLNNLHDWYDAQGRLGPDAMVAELETALFGGLWTSYDGGRQ
jgi:TetR/AcrR family transcriptional regulator, cholesterol catabolism regulator